ncbi:alpha/beta hydrolase [Xylogone sp. PMI_703]|nr:alpha/beta hydrolase [Xylogone sp. PMI_703]
MSSSNAPPFDDELAPIFANIPFAPVKTLPDILHARAITSALTASDIIKSRDISCKDVTIPGQAGDITLSILRSSNPSNTSKSPLPAVYFIHGGGMFAGNRFWGVEVLLDWIETLNVALITVEYRLGPENKYPAALEDCYSGLLWTHENSQDLEIDPARILLAGMSAGGGIAASLALLLRDRNGHKLCGQLLMCPMLDDRGQTVSCKQYSSVGTVSQESNETGWKSILGDRCGTSDVSIYAAPARATDLSGLPSAFVDVGSAELFRDEDVAYASTLWASGVQAELHVWPGGWHGFDFLAPSSQLGIAARKARLDWGRRTFGLRHIEL